MKRKVPIIITCDIDPTPEALIKDKRMALDKTIRLFDDYKIKSTLFFVANVAKDYPVQIENLLKKGHEIGCHGLNHNEQDEYSTLPESDVRQNLTQATDLISGETQKEVKSFRGPRVKTSHITQQVLEELKYSADSSVCSQRIDFLSSNLINLNWLFAPRKAYRPSHKNAFRKGRRNLYVVPVSAMVLPFVSGSLYTFGLFFMKIFFRMLYAESRITGKPIVYLLHPAEFAEKTSVREKKYSIKVEGFSFRRSKWIFEQNIEKRYALHQTLFNFMSTFPYVEFMTVNEYVGTLP